MNLLRKLFGRKRPVPKAERTFLGRPVVDMRSDEEKQIESEAEEGISLGVDIDCLVFELIEIGKRDGFISSTKGDKFDKDGRHIRAREIGTKLNEIGGYKLMLAVGLRVRSALEHQTTQILRPGLGRELEHAWGYIGDWWP